MDVTNFQDEFQAWLLYMFVPFILGEKESSSSHGINVHGDKRFIRAEGKKQHEEQQVPTLVTQVRVCDDMRHPTALDSSPRMCPSFTL